MLVAASGPSAVVRLSGRAGTITRPASGPIVGTTTSTLARDHALGPQAVAERDQDDVALGSAHAIERHEQVGALASRMELAYRPEPSRSRRSVACDDELAWLGCVRVEDHRVVVHGRDRHDLADAGRAVGPLGGGDLPIDPAAALDERHLLAGLCVERVRQPPAPAPASRGRLRRQPLWRRRPRERLCRETPSRAAIRSSPRMIRGASSTPGPAVSWTARWWLLCSPSRRPPSPRTSFSDSSNVTMRTPASRVLAIPGKASALARRWLAPPSGREQKYRPDCRSGDNGEVTVAPRRPPASFQIGSVWPAGADSRILLWMQQSQGVDDVPWRVRPETDPHRPALRSPACGMSAIRGEGLPGWGNVSRGW